jgi:hypothetical protein
MCKDGSPLVIFVSFVVRSLCALCGPSDGLEVADSGDPDVEAFRSQKLAFQLKVAPITAERPAGTDDAMARSGGISRLAHDRTHGTPGTG